MKRKNKLILILVLIAIIAILITLPVIDYFRVHGFEMPLFCIKSDNDYDDTITYIGIGYKIDIRGNFNPSDEYPGITEYHYYLMSKEVSRGFRD